MLTALFLCAFTPIYQKHDGTEKVDQEFTNIAGTLQDQQFDLKTSTPNLVDLRDRQIVIVSSGGWSSIMWRENQEIYAVRGSCVTIRR